MPRPIAKLLSLVFGLLLALVGIEIALQLASFAIRSGGHGRSTQGIRGENVILCVGDSHTYGTSVGRGETYPAQLEAYLDLVDPAGDYQVVNRGVPGMNSAQAVHALPHWLTETKPDFVIVWVGANNWWNRAGEDATSDAAAATARDGWLAGSRVRRLIRMLQVDASWGEDFAEPEADALHQRIRDEADARHQRIREAESAWFSDHESQRSDFEFLEVTQRDLRAIAEILDAANVDWMLASYPQNPEQRGKALQALRDFANYNRAQRDPGLDDRDADRYRGRPPSKPLAFSLHREVTRGFARSTSVPFLDTAADAARALAQYPDAELACLPEDPEGTPCLYVVEMGPHPTGLLYRYIAESIAKVALKEMGCGEDCSGG